MDRIHKGIPHNSKFYYFKKVLVAVQFSIVKYILQAEKTNETVIYHNRLGYLE